MEETEETEESEEEEEDVLEEEEEESLLPNRFNKSFNASGSVFFFGGNPYFLRMNELLFLFSSSVITSSISFWSILPLESFKSFKSFKFCELFGLFEFFVEFFVELFGDLFDS